MITQIQNIPINITNEDTESSSAYKITKLSELEYLADIVPQLQRMSDGMGESTLAHLFQMIIIEIGLQLDVEKYKENTLNI